MHPEANAVEETRGNLYPLRDHLSLRQPDGQRGATVNVEHPPGQASLASPSPPHTDRRDIAPAWMAPALLVTITLWGRGLSVTARPGLGVGMGMGRVGMVGSY